MMVTVQPPERSDAYRPGDRVRATGLIDLSLGPGRNYQTPVDIQEGDTGTILAHEHDLHGILAGGQYWWLIDFNGRVGWVYGDRIALVERNGDSGEHRSENGYSVPQLEFVEWPPFGRGLWRHPPRVP